VVELLDRSHQAEVSFLDEVEQRHAGRLVSLGDRHDQPQVRLDESSPRLGCCFDGGLELGALPA
jgi:hypothetical protein